MFRLPVPPAGLLGAVLLSAAIAVEPKPPEKTVEERVADIEAYFNNTAPGPAVRADEVDRTMTPALQAVALRTKAGNRLQDPRVTTFDLQIAIANLTRALELEPKSALTLLNRACAYLRAFDRGKALADVERALELNSELAEAFVLRAHLRLSNGDVGGCLADAKQAGELQPKSAEAWMHQAIAQHRKGALDEAIADYTKGLALLPPGAPGYQASGRWEFARPLQGVRHLIYINAYLGRAACYYAQQKWDAVFADLAAVQDWPDYGEFVRPHLWALRPRLNPENDAKAAALKSKLEHRTDDPWSNDLNTFVLGGGEEAAFLAMAENGEPMATQIRRSIAGYFAGMRRLAAGQKTEAAECFRKSVAADLKGSLSHDFSQAELKLLEQK